MAYHSFEHMFSEWQGIMIPNCCCIDLFEVNTHSYLTILFHYNHNGRHPFRILDLVYESCIKKFIDLFFHYHLILGIHVVRWLSHFTSSCLGIVCCTTSSGTPFMSSYDQAKQSLYSFNKVIKSLSSSLLRSTDTKTGLGVSSGPARLT